VQREVVEIVTGNQVMLGAIDADKLIARTNCGTMPFRSDFALAKLRAGACTLCEELVAARVYSDGNRCLRCTRITSKRSSAGILAMLV